MPRRLDTSDGEFGAARLNIPDPYHHGTPFAWRASPELQWGRHHTMPAFSDQLSPRQKPPMQRSATLTDPDDEAAIELGENEEPGHAMPAHPDYVFDQVLACESYSTVWKAVESESRREVAVKAISVVPPFRASASINSHDFLTKDEILSEADILTQLRHDNIVKLLAAPVIKGCTEALVFEFASDGDLFSALQSPTFNVELHSQNFMIQLADALEYIHIEGIVHSDLKLENVLVFGDKVKICDFGLAGRSGEVRVGPALGTLAYQAPELIEVPKGSCYTLDFPADVYAFGIMLHVVIFGKPPWDTANDEDEAYRTFKADPNTWSQIEFAVLSVAMRSCLQSMFDDTEHRVEAADVASLIRCAWFTDECDSDHSFGIVAESSEDED